MFNDQRRICGNVVGQRFFKKNLQSQDGERFKKCKGTLTEILNKIGKEFKEFRLFLRYRFCLYNHVFVEDAEFNPQAEMIQEIMRSQLKNIQNSIKDNFLQTIDLALVKQAARTLLNRCYNS